MISDKKRLWDKRLCVLLMSVIDISAGGGSSLDEFGVFFLTYQQNMLILSLASFSRMHCFLSWKRTIKSSQRAKHYVIAVHGHYVSFSCGSYNKFVPTVVQFCFIMVMCMHDHSNIHIVSENVWVTWIWILKYSIV